MLKQFRRLQVDRRTSFLKKIIDTLLILEAPGQCYAYPLTKEERSNLFTCKKMFQAGAISRENAVQTATKKPLKYPLIAATQRHWPMVEPTCIKPGFFGHYENDSRRILKKFKQFSPKNSSKFVKNSIICQLKTKFFLDLFSFGNFFQNYCPKS